jgi:molybdopterin synthase catalytic subunit
VILVTPDPLDAGALLRDFSAGHVGVGAIVSFVGKVRGDGTALLELDHHPTFTAKVIEAIARDAEARFEVIACTIVHRVGALFPGEAIVFVAAASHHRRPAFEAVDYLMDRLKVEAPLWKRECGPGGARWIEARTQDHRDRQRWSDEHAD